MQFAKRALSIIARLPLAMVPLVLACLLFHQTFSSASSLAIAEPSHRSRLCPFALPALTFLYLAFCNIPRPFASSCSNYLVSFNSISTSASSLQTRLPGPISLPSHLYTVFYPLYPFSSRRRSSAQSLYHSFPPLVSIITDLDYQGSGLFGISYTFFLRHCIANQINTVGDRRVQG